VTALIEDVAGLLVPKPDRLPNTIETLAFCPRTRARKRPSQPAAVRCWWCCLRKS